MFISLECEARTYGVNCGEICEDRHSCDLKDGRCSCTNWGLRDTWRRGIGTFIGYIAA